MRNRLSYAAAFVSCLAAIACGDDSPAGGNGGGEPTSGGGGQGGTPGSGGTPANGGGISDGGSGGEGPGAPTAASCDEDATCDGDLCLSEAESGFAGGYCSQLCAEDIGVSCGGNDLCIDSGAGYSICLKGCAAPADCSGAGQQCVPVGSDPGGRPILACIGGCSDDRECEAACDNDSNLCSNAEVCDNGIDEDGDALHDCQELDCIDEAICTAAIGAACAASTVLTNGVVATGDTSTGTDLFYGVCDDFFGSFPTGLAKEATFSYTATAAGLVTFTATQVAGDFGLYARTTCADGSTQLACADEVFNAGEAETIVLTVAAGDVVTVFVDAFEVATEGDFDIVASFNAQICGDGTAIGTEACDDGNTAAGDGCDATCQIELGFFCDGALPITLGTTTGDTTTGTSLFDAPVDGTDCPDGAGGGEEVIYEYMPITSGMLTIELTSTSDTDLGIYARTDCEDGSSQVGCADLNYGVGNNDESLSIPVTAAVPVTIFIDAYGAAGGAYSLLLTQN